MVGLQHLTVFAEAVVLDVEQAVFDGPMAPHQVQCFRRRQRRSAGHRILNAIDLNAIDLNAIDLNAIDLNAIDGYRWVLPRRRTRCLIITTLDSPGKLP